jgi:hypothetical protein
LKPPIIPWEIRGRRLVDGALHEQHVGIGWGSDAQAAIAWMRRHEPSKTASFPDVDLRAIPDPFQSPFPIRPLILASLVVLASVSVAAGGESISLRTMGLDHTTGPAWDSGGAADPCPRRITGSARSESISVAAWTDTQRPSRSEPWLSPDSLGRQSERAVSEARFDPLAQISPTENLFPTPSGSLVGLSADLPSGTPSTGVGDYFDRDFWAGIAGCVIGLGMFIWAGKRLDRLDREESARRIRYYSDNLTPPQA